MVPPDPRSIDRDGASRYPEKPLRVEPALPSMEAAEPSPSRDNLHTAAGRRQGPRLHEPFVSPEFAESSERTARMGDRSSQLSELGARFPRGIDHNNSVNSILSHMPQPEVPPPQAAPLYTVRAGRGSSNSSGTLVAPPTPIQDSQLLTKRLAVTAAGRSSVVGSSRAVAPPASGSLLKSVGGGPEQKRDYLFKPDKVLRPVQSGQEGDRVEPPLSTTPEDLSPLVAGAVCTWGQELVKILGQHVIDSAIPSGGGPVVVPHNTNGGLSVLTTTGNFPQTMQLRCSDCFWSSIRRHGQLNLIFVDLTFPVAETDSIKHAALTTTVLRADL